MATSGLAKLYRRFPLLLLGLTVARFRQAGMRHQFGQCNLILWSMESPVK
jgi:hypothetical protein